LEASRAATNTVLPSCHAEWHDGSTVFMAALDDSKVFDRACHFNRNENYMQTENRIKTERFQMAQTKRKLK